MTARTWTTLPRRLLPIIENPGSRQVLEKLPGDVTPYQGEYGDLELLCGNCRHTLAERVLPAGDGTVIRCPICRAFNLNDTIGPDEEPPASGWGALRARDLRRP